LRLINTINGYHQSLPITSAINLGQIARRAHNAKSISSWKKTAFRHRIMAADELEDYLEQRNPGQAPLPQAARTTPRAEAARRKSTR